jgi:hypothetical protein
MYALFATLGCNPGIGIACYRDRVSAETRGKKETGAVIEDCATKEKFRFNPNTGIWEPTLYLCEVRTIVVQEGTPPLYRNRIVRLANVGE